MKCFRFGLQRFILSASISDITVIKGCIKIECHQFWTLDKFFWANPAHAIMCFSSKVAFRRANKPYKYDDLVSFFPTILQQKMHTILSYWITKADRWTMSDAKRGQGPLICQHCLQYKYCFMSLYDSIIAKPSPY